jgi:GAF domain-containing protein
MQQVSADDRAEAFARLAWLSTRPASTLAETITAVVDVARETVPTDDAGLTVILPGRRLVSAGSTSTPVRQADDAQHALAQGPCLDAGLRGHQLVVDDLSAEVRWPEWSPEAARLGFRSVLSTGLHTADDRPLGALNLYRREPAGFGVQDQQTARLLAAHATAAIAAALRQQNLQVAVESRTVIGQAEGILMIRYGLNAEQAIAVLRRCSQQANIKLRDLAAAVVIDRGLPDNQRRTAIRH